jgi:hypothetical protein
MVVASVLYVSTECPVILANAHPDSGAMVGRDANRPKFEPVANQISTALTMPNVVRIEPVVAARVSSPKEPYAWMSTNVPGNPISAGLLLLVPTLRVVMNAVVNLR